MKFTRAAWGCYAFGAGSILMTFLWFPGCLPMIAGAFFCWGFDIGRRQ